MRGTTLENYGAFWQETTSFSVPFLNGNDILFDTVFNTAVFMQLFTEKGGNGNWQFVHARNDTRSCKDDLSMFKHKSSPALTNYHEVRLLIPNGLGKLNEEWIWICLHNICVPVSVILISNDNISSHECLWRVCWHSIIIYSQEFFNIWLHNLWPSLTIVKMDSIDIHFISEGHNLVNEHLPSFNLSVVEHRSVLEILCLTISTVADITSTLLCKIVKEEVFVFSMVSCGTDSSQGINDDLNVSRFGFGYNGFKTFVTSKHLVGLVSGGYGKWGSVILSVLCLISVLVVEWVIVSLESSHQVKS